MFQVGINSLTCEADGIVDSLQRIARHGFRNVEIWCNYAHLDPRLGPDVTMVRRVLEEEGLRAVSLHSPFEFRGEKLSVEAAWEAWENLMSQVVETAQYLRVGFLVVHPVLVCSPSGSRQGEREVAPCREESLRRVARLAARGGIRIALENLGRKTVADLAHPSEVMKLARRLGEDNIGVCFDTGHCLVSGLDPVRETDHCTSQVYSFHVHENDGVEDMHWVPGKGPIDWPRFFEKLRALKYEGPLILEIWGGKDGEGVVKDARAFVEEHSLSLGGR
ncbi:MAG: sugar phosphate isomerase/epimerase family protein [Candidatus Methylomirabilales bacterium]